MQRQVAYWGAGIGLAALALYLFGDILLPFVVGAALAYLLDPWADRLQRIGFGRLGATILILVVFVVFFALLLLVLVPMALQQIVNFAEQLPGYVSRLQSLLAEHGGPLVRRVGGEEALAQLQRSIGDVVGQGANWVATFARSLWTGGKAVVSVLSIFVVTPVVAFYLLVDWDRMLETVDGWVPPRHRPVVRQLAREIDHALSGFLRGQSALCLILGLFYAIALWMIGLNFGPLIGMLSGLISFIPYVGSLTGLFLSVGVAMVQFLPDWTMVAATLGIFFAGQFIEGNILSPKLVGASVGLHPVWVMFALLAFGSLFGFVGLLLAVPLAAIVGVVGRFALRRYQQSPFYKGQIGAGEARLISPPVEIKARIVRPEPDA
jgi:predicted PurR-regulated permease PerM